MTYAESWVAAIARSEKYNLIVPSHEIVLNHLYLDAKALAQFPDVVREGLGDLGFKDVVAQCMAIHYRMIPVIEAWLGCPVLFTIGWIDDGTEKGMFRFDDAFIETTLRSGHKSSSANIHAWLTLPSMEVIDVALATSVGVAQRRPDMHGLTIASRADDLKGFTYIPMLVGDDYLQKSGLLKWYI